MAVGATFRCPPADAARPRPRLPELVGRPRARTALPATRPEREPADSIARGCPSDRSPPRESPLGRGPGAKARLDPLSLDPPTRGNDQAPDDHSRRARLARRALLRARRRPAAAPRGRFGRDRPRRGGNGCALHGRASPVPESPGWAAAAAATASAPCGATGNGAPPSPV